MQVLESEIKLEQRCRVLATKHRCILLKIQAAKSWPDRILLAPNGRMTFMEFKRQGEKPTTFQAYTHEELRKLNFQVEVIDNFLQFQLVLSILVGLPPLSGSPPTTK